MGRIKLVDVHTPFLKNGKCRTGIGRSTTPPPPASPAGVGGVDQVPHLHPHTVEVEQDLLVRKLLLAADYFKGGVADIFPQGDRLCASLPV